MEDMLSDQQQKAWETGIWPGQSRVKIYLILACQVFPILRKHEYEKCSYSSEGGRTDLTFSPHHRPLCLPLEGLHIFHPDGCAMRDYHFMSAGKTREGPHVVYRETRSGVNGKCREQPRPDVNVTTIYGSPILMQGMNRPFASEYVIP